MTITFSRYFDDGWILPTVYKQIGDWTRLLALR